MNDSELNENFNEFVNRDKASSEMSTNMDLDNHQMQREFNRYKLKLQSYREKYERTELEICDVNQSRYKALFVLNDMQLKVENLEEQLKNVHMNYESCVEKAGGYNDLNEKLHTKISEMIIERNNLREELAQLKRNADDNNKKLARVNTMIVEQEQKNAELLQKLKEEYKNASFKSETITKQIDDVLQRLKISNNDDVAGNTMQ